MSFKANAFLDSSEGVGLTYRTQTLNLLPGKTYYYRFEAWNSFGRYPGTIKSFYVPSDDATLSDLSTGNAVLSPVFSSTLQYYIGSVPYEADQIEISATPSHRGASVQYNGNANRTIPLSVGNQTINIHVVSEDGKNSSDYKVMITRLPFSFDFTSANFTPVTTDQLYVSGIAASISLAHAPQPGSILTLVNNTGSDFILGRFSNLAHGQKITLVYDGKAYDFVANYYGGTGNDLVLHWADTKLFAWGQNNFGQLGDGSTVRSLTPKEVPASALLDGKTIISAGAGYLHSLVLCSDGSLLSWGYNLFGQLGDGSKTHRSSPVAVNQSTSLAGRRVVSIAVGPYHQLALCADGTVHAWGHNSHGQLGDGTIVDASTPVLVDPVGALAGKRVVAVAAGAYHSLALCSDGSVVAWGFNEEGELGNGSNISSRVPVAVDASGVLAGKRVTQIAAGQYHNMALCSDGTLVSWGYNLRGQLGNGSTSHANAPVPVNQSGVLAGKMIRTLRAGLFHSAVLCDDGAVALWGGNNRQQLGVSGMTQSTAPLLFSESAEDLSSGGFFLTIRRTDGSLAAWGENLQGQLGNGTTTTSAVPVAVETSAFPVDSRAMMHAAGSASLHNLSIIALPARDAPVDGIEAWRLATFGSAVTSPDAADLADCDGDGTCNLLEYAFGSNPHLADSASIPSWRKVNGYMELSIADDATQSDIVYGAECSSTLRDDDWQNVSPIRVNGARVFRIPINAQNRMFMRLKVTRSNN
jgi:alpha-tubulin suppressor-like RCC1 family protein